MKECPPQLAAQASVDDELPAWKKKLLAAKQQVAAARSFAAAGGDGGAATETKPSNAKPKNLSLSARGEKEKNYDR